MPSVLILRAPGTNCDRETAYAFELAGADKVEVLHLNRVLESPEILTRARILCIPGGFSFGDDIAAGKIFASRIRNHLGDAFRAFRDAGKLILGICNGFQVLLKSGLLLDEDDRGAVATLTWNNSALYTDRWIPVRVTDDSNCVFLRGLESMYLPIAHAEGRFVPRGLEEISQMKASGQLCLRYYSGENPTGSTADVAGVCDRSGRVFGLMPHPERFIDAVQHPHWTRLHEPGELKGKVVPGDGLALFRNAVAFFR